MTRQHARTIFFIPSRQCLKKFCKEEITRPLPCHAPKESSELEKEKCGHGAGWMGTERQTEKQPLRSSLHIGPLHVLHSYMHNRVPTFPQRSRGNFKVECKQATNIEHPLYRDDSCQNPAFCRRSGMGGTELRPQNAILIIGNIDTVHTTCDVRCYNIKLCNLQGVPCN